MMPSKVRLALDHVRHYHETIDTVIYFNDGQWLFMSSGTREIPEFVDEIDVSILEEAADEVDDTVGFPAIFQM